MNPARRFLADEGHAASPGTPVFAIMLLIAAGLMVIGIVAGCKVGRAGL
jgi:hypothetical protein